MATEKTPEERAEAVMAAQVSAATSSDYLRQIKALLAEQIAAALKARDLEWWSALALNDAVPPDPAAVKAYALKEAALAVTEEREAVLLTAHQLKHDQRGTDDWTHGFQAGVQAVIEAIQKRGA